MIKLTTILHARGMGGYQAPWARKQERLHRRWYGGEAQTSDGR